MSYDDGNPVEREAKFVVRFLIILVLAGIAWAVWHSWEWLGSL